MNLRIALLLPVFLVAGAAAFAQPPAAPPAAVPLPMPTTPDLAAPAPVADGHPVDLADGVGADHGVSHWYGNVEWLYWWIKGDTLPPLVTTAATGTRIASAGVVGPATTSVLFGDSTVNGDPRAGARLTLGYWFDDHQTFGIVANYFLLQPEGTTFAADSSTTPILARPFLSATTSLATASLVAFPGVAAGSVYASERSSIFHGGELLLRERFCCGCLNLDLLYGYRYLHLGEELDISETTLRLAGATTSPPLAGLAPGTLLQTTDQFRTVNDLNALEVGLVAEAHTDRLSVTGFVKIAAGRGEESVTIAGTGTRMLPSGAVTSVPAGILAVGTNSGAHSKLEYPVVPDLGFEVGYQVTPALRAFVGYELLYWNRVLRPGDQVDTVLNPGLFPFAPSVTAAARPLQVFNYKELTAQGLNVGVEFRY